MEQDGVSRVFLLKDEGFSEVISEIHPNYGGALSYPDRRATIDRADVIFTADNIGWEEDRQAHIVKSESILPGKTTKLQVESNPASICEDLERTLGKTGLTIVIDRLEPETIHAEGF